MDNHISIVCRHCQYSQPYKRPLSACPKCGEAWLDADYALLTKPEETASWQQEIKKRSTTVWRYQELLPSKTRRKHYFFRRRLDTSHSCSQFRPHAGSSQYLHQR